jgi:hypothetical protein
MIPACPSIFARKEHHRAVLGKQSRHFLGPVVVDVVAISPLQAADRVDVFQLADAVFQRGKTRFQIRHLSHSPPIHLHGNL